MYKSFNLKAASKKILRLTMFTDTTFNERNPDPDENSQLARNSALISTARTNSGKLKPNKQPTTDLTMEALGALHDDQAFFPSGILSFFGINEGVAEDTHGGEQIDRECGTMTTTYDVPDPSTKITRDTKLRYSWIIIFYVFLPLGDLISDAIITGNVSHT